MDVPATLAFYSEVLGFHVDWSWGEPPTIGGASLGGATIMFSLQPELAQRVHGHQHWISVDDADELYAAHVAKGARIISEIEDKPWDVREYVVEDPNGYHLRFTGPLKHGQTPSQPMPEGVQIARRLPNFEEFEKVAGLAFGYKETLPGLLEKSWGGVVATLDGRTIGVLRIVLDAPRWFSIWDVAVEPELQAHGIGSAMMRESLAFIRESSPGARVFLFTTKPGFYERLGFGQDSVTMCRV